MVACHACAERSTVSIPAQPTEWTVEMVRPLPDDGNRYEAIDGESFVIPAPSLARQRAVLELALLIAPYARGHRIGEALISPAPETLAESLHWQPDAAVPPLVIDLPACVDRVHGRLSDGVTPMARNDEALRSAAVRLRAPRGRAYRARMSDSSALPTMTVEEYHRFEESSPIRHEYVAGEVYAMSGATSRHNLIAGTIFGLLLGAERSPCRVFMSDMRVEVADDRYYYPDVAVICTPVAELDTVAHGPCVVVEVTSPSTARIDHGEKLDAYTRVPALRAYLIVDHRRRRVERHWRESSDMEWRREEIVDDAHTPIPVPCLDVSLTLDAIYRRVELPTVHEPETPEYDLMEGDA